MMIDEDEIPDLTLVPIEEMEYTLYFIRASVPGRERTTVRVKKSEIKDVVESFKADQWRHVGTTIAQASFNLVFDDEAEDE